MKEELFAFQLLTNNNSIKHEIFNTIYFKFANLIELDHLDANQIKQLADLAVEKIFEIILFYNNNISNYINDALKRQKEYKELIIENFEVKIYDQIKKNTKLYNNDTFTFFIQELLNDSTKTMESLQNQLLMIYDHFEKIIYYKAIVVDKSKFESLSLSKQIQELQRFSDFQLEISNPELDNISKHLPKSIKDLLIYLQTEIVTKPYKKTIHYDKITIVDILEDDFKEHYEKLLRLIESDELNLIDKDKKWIAVANELPRSRAIGVSHG